MSDCSNGQEQIPMPSSDDVRKCQFYYWYGIPELKRCSLKSKVIDLTPQFLEYLGSDGVVLPACVETNRPITVSQPLGGNDEISDLDYHVSGEATLDDCDENPRWDPVTATNRPDFPELNEQIIQALQDLGGQVFCKTNWSAPLDAAWINANTLKCQRSADIMLLLKSSDRTMFDLEHMSIVPASASSAGSSTRVGKSCETLLDVEQIALPSTEEFAQQEMHTQTQAPERPVLVLRKWANLNPAMEFRLFVRQGRLLGMCQRDVTTCYDFLADASGHEALRLKELLLDWVFASPSGLTINETQRTEDGEVWLTPLLGLPSYSIDVYIDRRDKVYLIDINVFGYPSDPLLFDWGDLTPEKGENIVDTDDVPFRTISSREHCRASSVQQGQQQGPIDVSLAPDFNRFISIVREQQQEKDDKSD
jgi:hypothetical protein